MIKKILIALMMLMPAIAWAQFTVVDADSHETLPGVYVYAEDGQLLTISNERGEVKALQGMVTLSLLSYEPMTLDATTAHGQVLLQPRSHELAELVVGRTEYMKISAAFRDVVSNRNRVVMYREGIADYYLHLKSGRWTRRIRACRQYEHAKLRRPWEDSVACWNLRLLDFNHVRTVQASGNGTAHGDTLMMNAMNGKTEVKDGVMVIRKAGSLRTIIDQMKFQRKTSTKAMGIHYDLRKMLVDWTYGEEPASDENLKAMRMYTEADFRWSKQMPVVPMVVQQDLAVFEITYPSRQDAKAEMKDKHTATDFTLPDCLPAMPASVIQQGKALVMKSFHEF